MSARTSMSHPIRLDLIDGRVVGVPGRIGMTFAPGKIGPSVQGYQWDRHLETDLARLRETYGATTLVCLVEPHELTFMQIENLPARATHHGLHCIEFPIVDVSIPRAIGPFHALILEVCRRLTAGETVAVHCRGGLGRTGIVAASCLIQLGLAAPDAVRLVREMRPGTIETREQEDFVVQVFAPLVHDDGR
ncbi:MAG: cyclin-dependent kinase inhibitor 3 family protein [Candidatus Sericytochromatia bacterium]|nr:cyclin-dependent kinase inhibitor 3 family protein [Candidatus Sericytochromatia bacterium]